MKHFWKRRMAPVGLAALLLGTPALTALTPVTALADQATIPELNLWSAAAGDLATDGYHWDSATGVLQLKDIQIQGDIILPNQEITIQVEGFVQVKVSIYRADSAANQSVSIVGVGDNAQLTVETAIRLSGNLTVQDLNMTLFGPISNGNGGMTDVLKLENSRVTTRSLSWMPDGGIVVTNSELTVESGGLNYLWTETLSMDEDSVIRSDVPLKNYGKNEQGLDGIVAYLPAGYSVAKKAEYEGATDKPMTIVDKEGNMAQSFVLQKQSGSTPTGDSSDGSVAGYTLTFETNGGSAIPRMTVADGVSVDLSKYVPTREGYVFTGWYRDAELSKKLEKLTMDRTLTIYAGWTEETAPIHFADVAEDAYYAAAVYWAAENGVASGVAEGQFGPEQPCTRAQIVTLLWNAAGAPEPETTETPFTDVAADAYYAKAVRWALEKGITAGLTATEFKPEEPCTRAQAVTFLYRNAGMPEVTGTADFADVDANAYYAKAVAWAVEQGITSGMGNGMFGAEATCTRGQIVTFLYNAAPKAAE